MDNLIYSLNATIPVFLVIVLGYYLNKINWIGEGFIKSANKICFNVTLPLLLIEDMMNNNFLDQFDWKFLIYCFVVTVVCCIGVTLAAHFIIKDRTIIAEFIQASYRSSAALLGAAFVINIYGNSGMVPLMILGAVPFYNIYAVVILTLYAPDKDIDSRKNINKTLKGIVTNPIILAIILGTILSALRVQFPTMIQTTISSIARMTTPLALIAIGGGFEIKKALGKVKPAVTATFLKLVGWQIVFIPIAIMCGFTESKLMAIIIMLGSPTTPSSYIMAKNMKAEGTLTSSAIVLTTLFSAFTITGSIFILRTLGYL